MTIFPAQGNIFITVAVQELEPQACEVPFGSSLLGFCDLVSLTLVHSSKYTHFSLGTLPLPYVRRPL